MTKRLNEIIQIAELRKKGIRIAEDGMKYCMRCGAPLQRWERDCNGIKYLMDISCRCADIQRQQNIEKVRRECFITPILSTYRYDSKDNKEKNTNPYLARFIRRFKHIKRSAVSLYIYSASDYSRTYNLARVANGLIDRGYTVKYLNTVPLSALLQILSADYTELMKKFVSFDAIAFADLDLTSVDETELKFLYGVISLLISNGVTLLISADKNIDDIQPETRYGQKIKELIKRKCMIIPVLDDIKDAEPKQVAKDVLWLLDDEEINSEE